MVKQKPNFFFFLFSFCFPYFPFGAVQSIPDSRSIDCAICNQFQVFLRCNQFQVPGFSTIFSFQVSLQKAVSQFRIIGIGSPGSRFAVLNLNSRFSSLVHLWFDDKYDEDDEDSNDYDDDDSEDVSSLSQFHPTQH